MWHALLQKNMKSLHCISKAFLKSLAFLPLPNGLPRAKEWPSLSGGFHFVLRLVYPCSHTKSDAHMQDYKHPRNHRAACLANHRKFWWNVPMQLQWRQNGTSPRSVVALLVSLHSLKVTPSGTSAWWWLAASLLGTRTQPHQPHCSPRGCVDVCAGLGTEVPSQHSLGPNMPGKFFHHWQISPRVLFSSRRMVVC